MNDKQRKMLFGLANKAQIGTEELRDISERLTGERSVKSLDCEQASKVINRVIDRYRTTMRRNSRKTGMEHIRSSITDEQISKIKRLGESIGKDYWEIIYWLDKYLNQPNIMRLSQAEANRIINTFKVMNIERMNQKILRLAA